MVRLNSNPIGFLLCISLMICSVRALGITLTDALGVDWYETEINILLPSRDFIGRKNEDYNSTIRQGTKKVIIYFTTVTRFNEVMQVQFQRDRIALDNRLSECNYQLLFMAVKSQTKKDGYNIGQCLLQTLYKDPKNREFTIETIAEGCRLNLNYESSEVAFPKFTEPMADYLGTFLENLKPAKGSSKSKRK